MLVDHADAEGKSVLRRTNDDFLAVDGDLALVGEVDAGEHVHQGRFAAAILTQQGEDLAAVDVQPDLVVGNDLAIEAFGDVAHGDGGRFVVHGKPPEG